MARQFTLAVTLAGLCLGTSIAEAQTPLPDGANYPDPQCIKPQADMVKPGAFDSGATDNYNAKIRTFNKVSAAYSSCMHTYIDKANGDVKSVQEKANIELKQITERANASIKAIQDKIMQAVADANSVTASVNGQTDKLRK